MVYSTPNEYNDVIILTGEDPTPPGSIPGNTFRQLKCGESHMTYLAMSTVKSKNII
jgi:hypothetical protein